MRVRSILGLRAWLGVCLVLLCTATAAQAQAQVRGSTLSLGAALVRYCNISCQVLDQRLASPDSEDGGSRMEDRE